MTISITPSSLQEFHFISLTIWQRSHHIPLHPMKVSMGSARSYGQMFARATALVSRKCDEMWREFGQRERKFGQSIKKLKVMVKMVKVLAENLKSCWIAALETSLQNDNLSKRIHRTQGTTSKIFDEKVCVTCPFHGKSECSETCAKVEYFLFFWHVLRQHPLMLS